MSLHAVCLRTSLDPADAKLVFVFNLTRLVMPCPPFASCLTTSYESICFLCRPAERPGSPAAGGTAALRRARPEQPYWIALCTVTLRLRRHRRRRSTPQPPRRGGLTVACGDSEVLELSPLVSPLALACSRGCKCRHVSQSTSRPFPSSF